MKKLVGYSFKCIFAAIIAVVLLSLFSLIYYNPPISIEQPEFITNFKFIPDSRWSCMLEGFGFGRINSKGYNSAYYNDVKNPDIVLIGSSHMESLQVPQYANCVYLLNEMFDKDEVKGNDFKCLNLGVSGHFFEVSASNFKYVAENFKGAEYAVIEVFDVRFSPSELDDIIEGKFHTPMEKKGFINRTAQKVPFFRLMHKKINEVKTANIAPADTANGEGKPSESEPDMDVYADKMNSILAEISKTAGENRITPIILMHNRFWKDKDGNIVMEMDEEYKTEFIKICENNGINVIDATPAMVAAYKEDFEFSYGFSNSVPGEGHLNKTGHRIIAEEMYKKINEMEAGK